MMSRETLSYLPIHVIHLLEQILISLEYSLPCHPPATQSAYLPFITALDSVVRLVQIGQEIFKSCSALRSLLLLQADRFQHETF